MDKQDRIFISYSRVNKDFALRLAKELKSAGFSTWLDQLDIATGARWDREVEKALKECKIFMLIITPAAIESENVLDEIGYAVDKHKRILPILLESCEVPLRLRRIQYVDFTQKNFDEGVISVKELLINLIGQPAISPKEGTQQDLLQEQLSAAQRTIENQLDTPKTEVEQLAAQKAEEERAARAKEEAKRRWKEEADWMAAHKVESVAERLAKEEADRLAAQKAAAEKERTAKAEAKRKAKEEADRLAAQKAAAEKERTAKAEVEANRKEKEQADRLEAQRAEEERAAKTKEEEQATSAGCWGTMVSIIVSIITLIFLAYNFGDLHIGLGILIAVFCGTVSGGVVLWYFQSRK